MNLCLSDSSVGTSYTDILVASTEASHCVTLEVRQYKEGFVVKKILTNMHFLEPFTTLNRKSSHTVLVCNINRAKIPSVNLKSLPVLLGGISASLIISVSLNYISIGKLLLNKISNPKSGDNVRALCLTCMKLNRNLAF